MGADVGSRVGALMGADGGTVKLFGYGVYEGRKPPVGAVGFMAEIIQEAGGDNPCILLDNGKRVFGCECWWGPEETVKAKVALYETVVIVDVDEERAKCLSEKTA